MLKDTFRRLFVPASVLGLAFAAAIGAKEAPKDVVKEPTNKTATSTPLQFKMKDINGKDVDLADYKGKVVLIVNVASKCGNTPQYKGLEEMYEKYKDQGLVVLGFPANNFLSQEPGTDAQIKEFCELTYHVAFPMMSKVSVNGKDQSPIYKYLTSKETNGEFAGDVEWNFGDQNGVRPSGNAGIKRNPAGIAPHHLDHEDAFVRLRRRVQPIDRIGREGDRRVESNTLGRAGDVVVARLGDDHDRHAERAELVRDGERAVAADRDERTEPHLVKDLEHAIGVRTRTVGGGHLGGERIAGVERPENGAAEPEDAGDVARRQHTRAIPFEQAVEAVFDTQCFDAAVGGGFHDGADDGVEPGRVAAACQYADTSHRGHADRVYRRRRPMALPRLKGAWYNTGSSVGD